MHVYVHVYVHVFVYLALLSREVCFGELPLSECLRLLAVKERLIPLKQYYNSLNMVVLMLWM